MLFSLKNFTLTCHIADKLLFSSCAFISGHLNDKEGMTEQINHAVALYEGLDTFGVSEHSLASAYHKLAISYLTTVSYHSRLKLLF